VVEDAQGRSHARGTAGHPRPARTTPRVHRVALSRRPLRAGRRFRRRRPGRFEEDLMTSFFDRLSYTDVAKTIDHSLLKPELDDASVEAGCRLAATYDVASVCVRPRDVERARDLLSGSNVAVGTVIGFPHGSSRTETKVFASRPPPQDGARGLDMGVDIGALIAGNDRYIQEQIAAVVEGPQ